MSSYSIRHEHSIVSIDILEIVQGLSSDGTLFCVALVLSYKILTSIQYTQQNKFIHTLTPNKNKITMDDGLHNAITTVKASTSLWRGAFLRELVL